MNNHRLKLHHFSRRRFRYPSGLLIMLCVFFTSIVSAYAQQTVRGKVTTDAGAAVPGASVQVKGTKVATSTNTTGDFIISAPGNATLVITNIGFETQEIKVDNQSNIKVQLKSSSTEMQQVVIVGYGTQRKATLSGSVATVKGSELTKSPNVNVSNSLVGRLPGLTAVNSGGEPGYDGSTLRIRGVNTFGNANPLIVVDGVPGRSLERIDPATIESVTVLKDASAAIYGAQAANGVILVTTKRGKTGSPSITVSLNQGYGRPTRLPKMADAAEYATALNEIAAYRNAPAKYTQEDLELYRSGADPWGHPNTDWFKEVLKPWSGQKSGNATVSGGNEGFKYFVSMSGRSQDGFYRNSATKYNQYDLRSNFDAKLNKYLSLTVDLSGRMEDRNFPTRSSGDIFAMTMRGKPNLPAYWPNGLPGPDIEFGNNPAVISTSATGYDRDKRYVTNTNFSLNFKVPGVEGLSITGNAALDKNIRFNKTFRTPWYLYSWDGTTRDSDGNPVLAKNKKGFDSPELNEYMEDNGGSLINALVNYEKSFDKHNFKFLAGAEKIKGSGDNFSAYRRNFISTAIDQLFAGGVDQFLTNNGSGYQNSRLNYFGRVNYAFANKYLMEFVWRYQASYIFEKSSRFGFFPGVSLGYVISEEKFWKDNLSFADYFKLRASVGSTGNDQIDPFRYLATYGLGSLAYINNSGATLNPTLYETGVPNVNTTWEKATQRNIGFDVRFLDSKLSVTADYFYNTRSNILAFRNASVPNSAGITLPPENIGKTANKGFDFSVEYRGNTGALNFQLGLNGGYAKNKVVFWDEPPGAPDYQRSTGYPIGSTLYYDAIGVFRTQADLDDYPHWGGARLGDVKFSDVDKNGVIDANDRIRINKNNIPTWTGGFTLALQYKGFDLSVLVQGAAGAVQYLAPESGEFGNFLKSFYDQRWTPENPNSTGPRTFNRSDEYWMNQNNTFWLAKTDYVRLKNVELGYTLPVKFQNWGIKNFRIYTNGFNLLTYSPGMKDYDPELSSGRGYSYPLQKIVNLGISASF
ncbi:TonB-dependent receptor [Mucilaginibacter sp. KACC 22773]|uniref:SusC/RagA family TonB-linked outer membrane protein n=1 Tax=Mucilaginibacter sp. KACC 22773 TaxID=3025671 RepID=UPI0023664B39|nr:TonB-dependent receptor [Mucilaginibacter sp. KACC 22773]WDF77164.1 TonB-dependent receptor [Mucilaginibacter sp. KACC 22773]